MKKPLKIALKVVAIVLAVVIVLLVGVKLGEKIWFASFYAGAEKEFRIPGLNDGFVPQGLTFDDESGKYLATGYNPNGPSQVYSFPKDSSKNAVLSNLKNPDGSDYDGHTGGISRFGDFVYITGADGIDVFDYKEILAGGDVKLVGSFDTGVDPAHCHIEQGMLYVGSFYIAEDYETPENERIVTPSGDANTSVIEVYALDENAPLGISEQANFAYSVRGQVQGMCFTKDKIVLSTSYGLSTSQLFAYDYAKQPTVGEYKIGETVVPLYYLDSSNLVSVTKAPPMAEELVYIDGRVVIFNESACNKYKFGKFLSGYDAYSIVIE